MTAESLETAAAIRGEIPQQQQQPQITNPVDLAKAVSGLVLQEAVNLGEINPAMQRRFGERMEQIWRAMLSGAGVQWGPDGDLKIIWPVMENPILAAAKARKAKRALVETTAIPEEQAVS